MSYSIPLSFQRRVILDDFNLLLPPFLSIDHSSWREILLIIFYQHPQWHIQILLVATFNVEDQFDFIYFVTFMTLMCPFIAILRLGHPNHQIRTILITFVPICQLSLNCLHIQTYDSHSNLHLPHHLSHITIAYFHIIYI